VDETERGWYVQYIERDAGILARQEAQQRRVEAERASEQKLAKQMEIQRVEAAKMLDRVGGTLHAEATTLDRDATVAISLSLNAPKKKTAAAAAASKTGSVLDEGDDDDEEGEKPGVNLAPAISKDESVERKRPTSSKDQAASKKKARKDGDSRDFRKENWICPGILVRIVSKKLSGGKYFKRKGVVDRVLDKFTAEIEVLDSGHDERDGGDVLRLDQDDLETVVPKEGKAVRIVNGRESGKRAKVVSLDKERCKATLKLDDGAILERVDYEDFSKIA
jgi:DNA/RNA-binding protein KIN17